MNPSLFKNLRYSAALSMLVVILLGACTVPSLDAAHSNTPAPVEISIQATVLANQTSLTQVQTMGEPQADSGQTNNQTGMNSAPQHPLLVKVKGDNGIQGSGITVPGSIIKIRRPSKTPTVTRTPQSAVSFTKTPTLKATLAATFTRTAVPTKLPATITSTLKPAATATFTRTAVPTKLPATITNTPQPTLTPTFLASPTFTPTTAVVTPAADAYGISFQAGFEGANLDEYNQNHGEFIHQGDSGTYSFVNDPVLNGNYAAALTIDSRQSGPQASYLFYYNCLAQSYYAAWFYIPEDIQPSDWWNIWQWKSTYNGDSNYSKPMWILDVTQKRDSTDLRIVLIYRPDDENLKTSYQNTAVTIPRGRWFHLAAYYEKSTAQDGHVTIWLDGQQIFDIPNAHTVLGDNTLYWSVNHYAESISPAPSTIYVDDVIISASRIPPEYRIP